MTTYKTFKRSCTNWEQFASARKRADRKGLTQEEARTRCTYWNDHRSFSQVQRGTKMEYTRE